MHMPQQTGAALRRPHHAGRVRRAPVRGVAGSAQARRRPRHVAPRLRRRRAAAAGAQLAHAGAAFRPSLRLHALSPSPTPRDPHAGRDAPYTLMLPRFLVRRCTMQRCVVRACESLSRPQFRAGSHGRERATPTRGVYQHASAHAQQRRHSWGLSARKRPCTAAASLVGF
jgi:hypothetical protein